MIINRWKGKRRTIITFSIVAFGIVMLTVVRLGRIASQGLMDEGRWLVYALSIQEILERPLFGAGLGTFADIFPAIRSRELHSWGVWDYAHSTILETAVEMGIPVAVLIAVGALTSIYIVSRAATRTGRDQRLLAPIAGVTTLGYLHSVIDFSLQIPGYFILFAVFLGCGLARAVSPHTAEALDPQPERRYVLEPKSN
jgi:O-antigen ligase